MLKSKPTQSFCEISKNITESKEKKKINMMKE